MKAFSEIVVGHFGVDKQTDMAIEEMTELSKALLKYRRNPTEEHLKDILEEVADVYIMLRQVEYMYLRGLKTELVKMIAFKINRTLERIEG